MRLVVTWVFMADQCDLSDNERNSSAVVAFMDADSHRCFLLMKAEKSSTRPVRPLTSPVPQSIGQNGPRTN